MAVGRGRQRVPLMMYFHAHYFFVTYHAASVVVIRRARYAVRRLETFTLVNETATAASSSRSSSRRFSGRDILCSCLARALAILPYAGTAVAFAWLEIYATSKRGAAVLSLLSSCHTYQVPVFAALCIAMDAIKEQFSYDDMDWALSKGALCYSCYFIASFPLVYWLDEPVSLEQPLVSTKSHRSGRSTVLVGDERWSAAKTVENALAAGIARDCHLPP
eukprot:COSAG02_NODE_305_length_25176_cov_30.787455_2_plen_219_part_00